MLAMVSWYASYGGEDDSIEGSEQDDLEKIDALLLRLSPHQQQRSTTKAACWMQAQKFLSDYWPAVGALATQLLQRKILDGREVHRLIWQTIGSPDADGSLEALNMQYEGASETRGIWH